MGRHAAIVLGLAAASCAAAFTPPTSLSTRGAAAKTSAHQVVLFGSNSELGYTNSPSVDDDLVTNLRDENLTPMATDDDSTTTTTTADDDNSLVSSLVEATADANTTESSAAEAQATSLKALFIGRAAAQLFDMTVNKVDKAARQDREERSERISLDLSKTQYTSVFKSPPDAYVTFAEKGASNAHLPKRKIFHQSVLGGCYVGFGGLISLAIAGNVGGVAAANPGVAKMTFAALFPVNLLLIMSTSGQLFTGNSATVAAARFEGFVSWHDLWRNWAVSLAGNIAGCSVFAALAILSQIMNNPGSTALAISSAVGKCSAGFLPTVMKAVLCNWMVSMAVYMAGAANGLSGKMIGCWLPISTFVGIGLEHSIANLFVLPLGLMLGAPISLGAVIGRNLVPVILGNAIAGALVVAASYSYQFGRLGGLRRAIFDEKFENMKKQLQLRRDFADKQLQEEIKMNQLIEAQKVAADIEHKKAETRRLLEDLESKQEKTVARLDQLVDEVKEQGLEFD